MDAREREDETRTQKVLERAREAVWGVERVAATILKVPRIIGRILELARVEQIGMSSGVRLYLFYEISTTRGTNRIWRLRGREE